jgi:hypothetical protein
VIAEPARTSTASVTPGTSTGVSVSGIVPVPRRPREAAPQHHGWPEAPAAHASPSPTASSRDGPIPLTSVGTPVLTTPSAPVSAMSPIIPQHATAPVRSRAQVVHAEAAMPATSDRPATTAAASRRLGSASPRWPRSLSPQQTTSPAAVIAQAWAPPTAMATAPCAPGTTAARDNGPTHRLLPRRRVTTD